MNIHRTPIDPAVQGQLEARLGSRLAAALNPALDALPADVESRLRFAREQALARRAAAPAAGNVSLGAGGAAVLGRLGTSGWWPRLGWLLPMAAVAVGVLLVQLRHERDAAAVAAQIDSALLADELPPAAYADPGFAAFLKLQQP
ncbi:DUF3619 family protein [Rubrivivax albus]|uniref:DUF3619 family protein n=1 Tax=Rubrivivax albus TaxID=2499835 RepID=UPI001E48C3CB|nr:DUF3619 family protein [Rubrivivax albus]